MKWSEVKRRLTKYGCYKMKGGKRHEKWYSPITKQTTRISRHNSEEAALGTVTAVFEAMGVPMHD